MILRHVQGIRDALIGDLLWLGWCNGRRIVPLLPGIVPSLLPSLPPDVTGGAAVAHGRWRKDKSVLWSFREKRRHADRRGSGLKGGEGHRGSRRPLPGVAAISTLRKFVSIPLFFSRRHSLPRFSSVLLGSLTACAPSCCT